MDYFFTHCILFCHTRCLSAALQIPIINHIAKYFTVHDFDFITKEFLEGSRLS